MTFQRTKTSGIIRGAGEGSVAVSGGYQRSATPLPTLYEELEPTYSASLGFEAERTIREDVAWTQEHLGTETGGWLLGSEHNPSYVLRATVPGRDSSATRSSINLGTEQLAIVQRQYPDHRVVGCWHLQPDGDDVPSQDDLRGFARCARAVGGGRWLSLIVAPSQTWRSEPEISGWITFGPRRDLLICERLRLA